MRITGTATITIRPTVAVMSCRVLLTTPARGALCQATIPRNIKVWAMARTRDIATTL